MMIVRFVISSISFSSFALLVFNSLATRQRQLRNLPLRERLTLHFVPSAGS